MSLPAPKSQREQRIFAAIAAGGVVVGGSTRLCTPQGTLQRQYTFDTTTQSWTTDSGTLTNASGRLRLSQTSSAQMDALEPASAANVADGEVWVDVYPVTADSTGLHDMGILFRATDANNHYLLALRSGTATGTASAIQLYKKVAGTYTSLAASPNVAGPPSQPFINSTVGAGPMRVLVRFVGSQLSFWINETLVGLVTDSTLSTGRVGVRSANGPATGTTIVDYDNVTVLSLPSNWTPASY